MSDAPRRPRGAEMTPEERVAAEAVRARNRTASARAEHDRVRKEFPPASIDPGLAESLAALRRERERQGLSLSDVAERTGMDRATISRLETGKVINPTVGTLRTYAGALGRSVVYRIEPRGGDEVVAKRG